ncbi:MAG TPA: glycosyltransferase family protein [Candidatus Sulfotelmatobacter sp.]|nr:glycosyltransferase family protein [Candidatus Sulfotelmatobacter sp.]
MANILYGVNGEGAGHSTRSREVLTHLVAQGHRVYVASFDRGLQNLKDQFDVTEIYGFRFAYVNNRVRYKRTIAKNLITAPHARESVSALNALVDQANINLVITDFEPLTCHIGHKRRLPIISIDNQHCLTNLAVSYPKQYRRDAAAAKLVTKLMTPRADAYLVISFFTAPIRKPNTFLFPPLLRQEILRATPTESDHVLVYVTSPAPALAKLLSSVRCRFVAYGFGREGKSDEGNVTFKKPSLDDFFADLVSSRAVIANSGFSLLTEALHLGKPYLAVPVSHQFEQVFNAYWVEKSGYGAYWEELNKERIESFLYNLPAYREALSGYPKSDNQALFQKLDQLIGTLTSTYRRPAEIEPK